MQRRKCGEPPGWRQPSTPSASSSPHPHPHFHSLFRSLLLPLSLSLLISRSLSSPQGQKLDWAQAAGEASSSEQTLPDAEHESSVFQENPVKPGQFDQALDSLVDDLDSTTGKEEAADRDDPDADLDSDNDAWAASDSKWSSRTPVNPTALPDAEHDTSVANAAAFAGGATSSAESRIPLTAALKTIDRNGAVDFAAIDPGALHDEEGSRAMFEDSLPAEPVPGKRSADPAESSDLGALPDQELDSGLFKEAESATKSSTSSPQQNSTPASNSAEPNALPDAELDTSAFQDADVDSQSTPLRGTPLVSQGMEDSQVPDSTPNSLDSAADASNLLFDRPDPELDGPLPTGDDSLLPLDNSRSGELIPALGNGVYGDGSDPVQDLEKGETSADNSGTWEVPKDDAAWDAASGDLDGNVGGASFEGGSLDFSAKWLQAYKAFLVGQDRKRFQRYKIVKTWVPGPKREQHMRTITVKKLKKRRSRRSADGALLSRTVADAKGMQVGELRPVPDDLLDPATEATSAPGGAGSAEPLASGAEDDPGDAMGVKEFERMAANAASAQDGGAAGTPPMKVVLQQAVALPWCARKKAYDNATTFARFDMYGCLRISGIHTGQTYLKTVIVIDRTDANNTMLKLPSTGQNAYGEELTLTGVDPAQPAEERALNVKSNVFCSTGQFMPDGTLLSIGGSSDSSNADPLLNGSYAIRAFKPCDDKTCDFDLVGAMTTKRWYPTAQIMPDGRVLIVGGANVFGNIAINTPSKNNPTVEYYPRRPQDPENYYVSFLEATVPYNLYAFVHVLPSGLVFLFAADRYTLFDPATNQEVPGDYPQLNCTAENGAPIYRSYPISGSSALFPLSPANNYTAEIMVCGGNNMKATIVFGNGGASRSNGLIPADYFCWRITPESKNPTWVAEKMCRDPPQCTRPLRRVMGDMVLLADGSVLIINGAATGYQGLKQDYASEAQQAALLYLPKTHKWYNQSQLPDSQVPRMYHSSALLLHDCTVLVTGSNPNPYLWTGGKFPTEFRMEKFIPPYLTTGRTRPNILDSPRAVTVNSDFTVYFNATRNPTTNLMKRFEVAVAYPGFSTHNQRHGMRHVVLEIRSIMRVAKMGVFVALVKSPPSLRIAPPTMYWLHVLDNGVPNVEGRWINITASARPAK